MSKRRAGVWCVLWRRSEVAQLVDIYSNKKLARKRVNGDPDLCVRRWKVRQKVAP